MKNHSFFFIFLPAIIVFVSCKKMDPLTALTVPVPKIYSISFKQDTVPVTLTITSARKENIGNILVTAIDGKLPDSIVRPNNLIIRVTGDSTRLYNNTEIFASYTDSTGNTFSTETTDTINTVRIIKMEKRQDGTVEGNFTLRVSNFTKTKVLLLNNGKFSTGYLE